MKRMRFAITLLYLLCLGFSDFEKPRGFQVDDHC